MSEYGPEAPVPIFQHRAEFEALLDLYRQRKPKRVLEIGTYHGGTLYHWLLNASPGAIVVSLDTYTAADNRRLYADWPPSGVELRVIEGDSRDPAIIARATDHGPYDWLFIDADHYYEGVKADWENYRPICAPGAIVVFHDIVSSPEYHPEIEVGRLWEEIKANYRTEEIVHDRSDVWAGLGVVYLP